MEASLTAKLSDIQTKEGKPDKDDDGNPFPTDPTFRLTLTGEWTTVINELAHYVGQEVEIVVLPLQARLQVSSR